MTIIYNLDYIVAHLLSAVYNEEDDQTEIHMTTTQDLFVLPGDQTDVLIAGVKNSKMKFIIDSDDYDDKDDEDEEEEDHEDDLINDKDKEDILKYLERYFQSINH